MKLWLYTLVVCIVFSCAKQVRIEGGEKDITPPVILSTYPTNNTLQFSGNEFSLKLNEYVVLDAPEQNIIFSPPLNFRPNIKPQGSPRKEISILLDEKDTLLQNTTYTISFYNTIKDNTEGNLIPFHKMVLSTGDYIDSLKLRGSFQDPFKDKEEKGKYVLGLYPWTENSHDSIFTTQRPNYIAISDSTDFEIPNIKEGTYKALAFMDLNNDLMYSPVVEKVAYQQQAIYVQDSMLVLDKDLIFFKEKSNFRISDATWEKRGVVQFAADSAITAHEIVIDYPKNLNGWIEKNSITNKWYHYFSDSIQPDSIRYFLKKGTVVIDTLNFKNTNPDSLQFELKEVKNQYIPGDTVVYTSLYPIMNVIEDSIQLIKDKDTIPSPRNIIWTPKEKEIKIVFPIENNSQYKLDIKDSAIWDFFSLTNKKKSANITIKDITKYGKLILNLSNTPNHSIVVYVIDANGSIIREKKAKGNQKLTFSYLSPGKVKVKLLLDKNSNGKYDTGIRKEDIQPEEFLFLNKTIELREYWDIEQDWDLKSKN